VTDGLETRRDCTVVAIEETALDVSTRKKVETQLRNAAAPNIPLVIDWSNVVYVDRLGLETLFDFLIERTATVAFSGVNRDVEHFFLRLQILPLLPIAATVEEAAALLERSS
jgi:anti-anti-sigma regulatory factor